MENKMPMAMPSPPQDIKRIIEKLDSDIKLTEKEHRKLANWEDEQGGFGGVISPGSIQPTGTDR